MFSSQQSVVSKIKNAGFQLEDVFQPPVQTGQVTLRVEPPLQIPPLEAQE